MLNPDFSLRSENPKVPGKYQPEILMITKKCGCFALGTYLMPPLWSKKLFRFQVSPIWEKW